LLSHRVLHSSLPLPYFLMGQKRTPRTSLYLRCGKQTEISCYAVHKTRELSRCLFCNGCICLVNICAASTDPGFPARPPAQPRRPREAVSQEKGRAPAVGVERPIRVNYCSNSKACCSLRD
jgi:hypothetical protein